MKHLIAVSAILAGAVGVLVWVGIVQSSIPVLTVTQLRTGYAGGAVQLDGGKVAAIQSLMPLSFTIASSEDPTARVEVRSDQIAPENLKEGTPVSLRGTYEPGSNSFQAYRISTQCPSRYEAANEAPGTAAAGTLAPPAGAPYPTGGGPS